MCPTCLEKIPLVNRDDITVAHIVPKAAGGRLKTYLCRQCNSSFGERQDKWFGEFIKLTRDSKTSIFSTTIKDGYFYIDGQRINGYWKFVNGKTLETYVDDRMNSPEALRMMDSNFFDNPRTTKLKIPLPILRNEMFIKAGFLTAGYLLWFATFGYSWVLQKHLDIVRKQICSPDKEIISNRFLGEINFKFPNPWIAFIPIWGKPTVAFGYLKTLIIFPPKYEPDLYNKLSKMEESIDLAKIQMLRFQDKIIYDKPLIVLQDQHIMIAPELSEKQENPPEVFQFCSNGNKPKKLVSINNGEFERLSKIPGTIIHRHKL